jgi:UDP-glucose 4-epimerase
MRAVVVGGNGFIGSHLVDTLLADGWQVVVYDRAPERYRPPLAGVEYVLEDLGNTGLLASVLPRADVVFHLASTTIPKSSNDAPVFDIQSNLIHTVRLLEVCVRSHVGRVVFFSSGGTVYGVPQSLPVDEEHPTNPICAHGIVKLAIEKYLHLFKHLYGLSYVILRPSNPYGQRQNPAGNQGAVSVFLGHIAQGLPITIWGDGEVTRDFFHITDLAEACLLAATSETISSVFNVGSGKGMSLNQLLKIIEPVVQRPFRVVQLPARPFDVSKVILDIRRARAELNWVPKVSLEEGIPDTWDWVRSLQWLNPVS